MTLTKACAAIVEVVIRSTASGQVPLVVAIDGRSGAGKSTLASRVAKETGAAVVLLDDFFAASIPDVDWDRMTVEERGANVFDWARIRSEAIMPLLAGRVARWHPFDFESGQRADGTYGMKTQATEVEPASVIVVDGAYSAGPQLTDLVGLTVLVELSEEERWARLARREEAEFLAQWHARWTAVEDFYFSNVRPRSSFDLIVTS
ncbi:MAG: hypothetical protein OXH72_16840 [Caldilineaceae bacterium]|nr:hypothetical protein [Caldilineaceae bacterium]MYA03456.1 hypothetical protein [Caldilineaceae bacterium SB0664_bin_22]MYC63977.1 hypothetical protein [Caldilineaceae bacterium SB0661_bin_34]